MEKDILDFISDNLKEGRRCAMILLERNEGSTPGIDGSVMAVDQDGNRRGTIGGGKLEFRVLEDTMKNMKEGKHFSFEYDLHAQAELGMVCGGTVTGFVKYFKAPANLVVFGAGHVGEKIVQVAKAMDFNIYVVDDREEYQSLPTFQAISGFLTLKPEAAKEGIPFGENTYILVVTRGHVLDQEAYKACLGERYAYIGGMGSRKKALETFEVLRESGFSEEVLARLHLPVGLDIADGTPGEIAVSIMAELLMVKNGKTLRQMKDR